MRKELVEVAKDFVIGVAGAMIVKEATKESAEKLLKVIKGEYKIVKR